MHYKGYIITKKIPTDDEIQEILEPYNENKYEDLEFAWDWFQIGGRYGGKIKINYEEKEFFYFKQRNYKYFIINILSKIQENMRYYEELDYLKYMGLKDNILYVDGAYYSDIVDFDITNCYFVIDTDRTLYSRELWKNETFITDCEFDDKVKKIDLKDKFITVVDLHD